MKHPKFLLALAGALLLANSPFARAEAREIRIAQQYGISYLPMLIVENQKLVEKHARAAGLGEVKVSWAKFAGANVMNDALLSGTLDIASAGVPPAITLWGKTRGEIRLVAAMNSMPNLLNTRNPKVRSIRDLSSADKIALPAVKVGFQPVLLQMAAEKEFGPANVFKLDPLTVSLAHPDALIALTSGSSEITAHFAAPPFAQQELRQPGIRTILNSYDVLGGPATFNVLYSTKQFHDGNPRLYGAFLAAFQEATDQINRDKRAAARTYLELSKDKSSVEEILEILADPQVIFTTTPQNVTKYSDFLQRIGSIKEKPASWKDLFFPEVHALPGS
ncbi:MAG: ABC transporter substrate-binding protein [Candidatus Dactylopiibacterium sp.]|nr:ABC transporter substrate-binding protein [Candidatus Dactylopiibacterium sp.]